MVKKTYMHARLVRIPFVFLRRQNTRDDSGSNNKPHNWYAKKFKGTATAGDAVFEAYKMAMDVRKFEIELYWKRAAYFWAFIVIAFGAYGAMLTAKDVDATMRSDVLFMAACIGTVLSVALYFANRGSKFWQRNWEYQVDLLEDDALGPLYKHVFAKAPLKFWEITSAYPFSVSNINSILSVFFICVFVLLACLNSGLSHALYAEPSVPKIGMAAFSAVVIWRLYKDGRTAAMKRKSDKDNTPRVDEANLEYTFRTVRVSGESWHNEDESSLR